MKIVKMAQLDANARAQILAAINEPVLVVDDDRPLVVIRNLLDDDDADDLIAMHPEFQQSIRNARWQKAAGLVRSLADLRQKYALEEEHDSDLP